MNIRTAILRAADSIEMNPDLFKWSTVHLPNVDCGTPGCALGWIAVHRGEEVQMQMGSSWIPDTPVGIDDGKFYCRMSEISNYEWKRSALVCAQTLRLYADKFHPESESKQSIPQSVLNLFKEKVAA